MLKFVMQVLLVLAGGFLIGEATDDLKKNRHFMFGVNVMLSVWTIVIFVKYLFM